MNTAIRRTQAGLYGVMALVMTAATHQLAAQSATRLSDEPAQHRFVLVLDAAERTAPSTAGVVTTVAGSRMAHHAMLNRFRVDVLDSAGRPATTDGRWEVTLFANAGAGQSGIQPVVRLSTNAPVVSVPRPFGYELKATDSLLAVARFDSTAQARGLRLRVTAEYDPIERQASRLAVWTMPATGNADSRGASANDSAAVRTWEWRATTTGELVAITGLPLAGVSRLVLQDAETGEVLWRSRLAGADARSTANANATIRPGANVDAGRVYRLTASYAATAQRGGANSGGTPVALILPTRTPAP